MKLYLGILYFFIVSWSTYTQNDFNSLGESAFGVSHNVSKKHNLNFTLRSRYFLYFANHLNYKQQQVDVYHLSTFKLKQGQKAGLGVYFRNRDWFNAGSNELRFMEQFEQKTSLGLSPAKHRFRAEQRFFKTKTIFRQRYRFSMVFPLAPTKIETGTTYLSTAAEALWSLDNTTIGETDIRITALMVWPLFENLKLKTGLEHRLEAFNLKAKNYLFVLTSAILNI